MTLGFHPAVQQDFNAAIDYYAAAGGGHLADRFSPRGNCAGETAAAVSSP
jgi:hypothetical protein